MPRRSESHDGPELGLSFLDTVSCGLGGSLLLMLVFAAKTSPAGNVIPPIIPAAGAHERDRNVDPGFTLFINCDGASSITIEYQVGGSAGTTVVGAGSRVAVTPSQLGENVVFKYNAKEGTKVPCQAQLVAATHWEETKLTKREGELTVVPQFGTYRLDGETR